jgi:hypothetical protein
MICGAVLIAYGVIAPAGILLRNVVQGLRAPNSTAKVAPATKETLTDLMIRGQESAARSRIAARAIAARAAFSPSEQKDRDEILKLYAAWKNAWVNRDVEKIIRLYSPRARFRMAPGAPLVDYTGLRTSLGRLVRIGYTVVDEAPASLSINRKRAILVVRQSYRPDPNRPYGLKLNHRFVLERQQVGSNTQPWRIVGSEYERFNSTKDGEEQIY